MRMWLRALVVILAGFVSTEAAEFKIEKLEAAPPDVDASIAKLLAPSGYKVTRDDSRVQCEVWLLDALAETAKEKLPNGVFFGFEPGSLVGVMRFPNPGSDFRGQDIAPGTYTMRYQIQPESGTHVGTFESRDFLLLVPAADDKSPATFGDLEKLNAASAKSAGTEHAAVVPLMRPDQAGETPAIRHQEEKEWWIVTLGGKDGKGAAMPVEMIVAGKAE